MNPSSLRTCFLHVGMPKTGTTSVQHNLYYHLTDPRFQYISFGEINGSRGLSTIFGDNPRISLRNKFLGLDQKSIQRYRERLSRKQQRALQRARARRASLIISAESCWNMDSAPLARIRAFLNSEGYRSKVIIYLRPWMLWLPSILQEKIKNGLADLPKALSYKPLSELLDYVSRIERMREVFGAEAVELRKYDRASLHGGCVVEDFFHCIKAERAASQVSMLNDSLGAEACKLLYNFNRHHFPRTANPAWLAEHSFLLGKLNGLSSEPLRLARSLLEHIIPFVEQQQRELLERYGVHLPLGLDALSDAAAVRDEQDMMSPSTSTMQWLAINAPSTSHGDQESMVQSQRIADQLVQMARSRSSIDRLRIHYHSLRREWRHLVTGN